MVFAELSSEEATVKFQYLKDSPIGDELHSWHIDALFSSFLPEGRASTMCDATQAETAAEGLSAERRYGFHEFQSLYRDWLAARAACNDPDVPDDEAMSARSRKCDAVELALLVMPAPSPWCFYIKEEVLERLVASEAEDGKLTNNRVAVALAAIKADLLLFRLKDPE